MKLMLIALFILMTTSCQSKQIETLLGGEEAYALVSDLSMAKTCEVYRIGGYVGVGKGAGQDKKIYGYPIISGPTPIDDASRATLSKVLSDPNTYLWNVAKGCESLPGVALRLADAKTQVDVLICFSCDELEIYTNGRRAGHEDFDPRRADLIHVSKKLFPKDKKIQSLKN
jgi:hypothetical protein